MVSGISSLKINLGKSKIVLVGYVLNVETLVGILGCKVAKLPMTYFGLPLGPAFKEKILWNSVIEKENCGIQ